MATNPETEDWLEMEVTWVERTLDEVVLVMKLACSNEVADRDDCGRTCVVDHNMRDSIVTCKQGHGKGYVNFKSIQMMIQWILGLAHQQIKIRRRIRSKLLCNSSKFMKTTSNSPLRSQKYSCTPNRGDPMGERSRETSCVSTAVSCAMHSAA
ncbi:hypothetical protein HID58_002987 [Brassica napus]|uniref:Uncharacterized protein n=1 Tax=Brassica napus TaxID=3708 RepID=A0ABQ8EP12_BRANA|nr:hypothetical protein HID58_002987 [Brassica napus]